MGARRDLLEALRVRAENGHCTLLVSGEADDLATICDRVVLVRDGLADEELEAPITASQIVDSIYGIQKEDGNRGIEILNADQGALAGR